MSDKKKGPHGASAKGPLSSGTFGGVQPPEGKSKSAHSDKKKQDVAKDAAALTEQFVLLKKAQEDLRIAKEQVTRLQADIQNISRRHDQELSDTRSYAVQKIIEDMLGLMDGFDGCLQAFEQHGDGDAKTLKEGVVMTHRMFLDLLKHRGVVLVEPAKGDRFDPHQHEAMAQIDDKEIASQHIIQVIQKGYALKDRVIRPARVILAK